MITQTDIVNFLNNELTMNEINTLFAPFANTDDNREEKCLTIANRMIRHWTQDQILIWINEYRLEKL